MEDKILERMLDNLIEEAGPIAIENMESKQEEVPEVQFSKEHEEKMKKIFAEYRKELEAKNKVEMTQSKREEKASRKTSKSKIRVRRLVALVAVLVLGLGLLTTTNRMERQLLEIFS